MDALSPADIAAILEKLGLDPATTDVAALLAKLDELIAGQAKLSEVTTQATDAAGALAAAQAELDKTRADFETLYQKQQEAEKAQREAGADAILEQYADRVKDEKMRTRIRALLLSDRESAMDILQGLPTAAAPVTDTPPAPQHDPAARQQGDDGEAAKVAEQTALIKSIQAGGKFKDYTAAREEARRQKPELFS